MARTKQASKKSTISYPVRNTSNIPEKRSKRFRPGTVSLKEIRKFQKSTCLLMGKLPFNRLVREVIKMNGKNMKVQPTALLALQEASENRIVELFEKSNLCTIHAKRVGCPVQCLIQKAVQAETLLRTSI